MNRLEQLHKAYEEKETYKQEGWMFTYNELPPHGQLVAVWRREVVNGVTVDMFGYLARWVPDDGAWCAQGWNWVDWNIVAWHDI
ncbi:hypothetical protein [Citrobacter phage Tr1]|nr:hypothetical protein [Citrobacter phage Tr1]